MMTTMTATGPTRTSSEEVEDDTVTHFSGLFFGSSWCEGGVGIEPLGGQTARIR